MLDVDFEPFPYLRRLCLGFGKGTLSTRMRIGCGYAALGFSEGIRVLMALAKRGAVCRVFRACGNNLPGDALG